MNFLKVITDPLLYRPGDAVQGFVWLAICLPTSGKTLRIKLIGEERCVKLGYKCKDEVYVSPLIENNENNDHILWEANKVFPYGSYRIPFHLEIPKSLPGSFECTSIADWKLSVRYTVTAYVLEDPDLVDVDDVPVMHIPFIPRQEFKSTKSFDVSQLLGLSKGLLSLEFSIKGTPCYTFDDEVFVNVAIENSSRTFKLVEKTVKLFQCLTLEGQCTLTPSVIDFADQGHHILSNDNPINGNTHSKAIVKPFGRQQSPHHQLEWERVLLCEAVPDKTDSCVILDLKKRLKIQDTESSVSSTSVKCQYKITLFVKSEDGKEFEAPALDVYIHNRSDATHTPQWSDKLRTKEEKTMFYEAMLLDGTNG